MTAEAIDALMHALEASEGLPMPTSRELAGRVERALTARGYEVVRTKTSRGDRQITGYPCTCSPGRGCLEHPFGPRREVNP